MFKRPRLRPYTRWILLFTLWCSVGANAQPLTPGMPGLHATEDTRILDTESIQEELEAAARALPAPPVRAVTLTLKQALDNTRAFVSSHATPQALSALDTYLKSKPAAAAAEVAAAAVAERRFAAGLQALLTAHQKDPGNPRHLGNLAALLNGVGRPNEALALLSSVEGKITSGGGWDLDFRATVLAGKGRAYLLLGKPAEAEAVLRQAVALAPLLKEARFSLALALHKQNKRTEAQRWMRAAQRRSPPLAQAAAEEPTPVTAPSTEDAFPEEATTIWPPVSHVFNLAGAKDGTLPVLGYPGDVSQLQAFAERVHTVQANINARTADRQAAQARLVQQASQRAQQGTAATSDLTQERLGIIASVIAHYRQEPSLKGLWEHAERSRTFMEPVTEALTDALAHSQDVVTADVGACNARQACVQEAEARFRARNCTAVTTAFRAWNAGMHGYDEALAKAFRPTYRLLTGLVATVSDPVAYQSLLLELDNQMDIVIQDHLAMAEQGAMLWVHVEVSRPCGLAGELPPLQAEQLPDPLACPLTGPYKVSLDLEIVGISFNCEKIGVELSKGLRFLDLFAEMELEYSGKFTVFVGAKLDVGAGGLSAAGSAKAGLYFSVTNEGVRNVGAKVSASQVLGAVPAGPLPFGVALERESESSISFVSF